MRETREGEKRHPGYLMDKDEAAKTSVSENEMRANFNGNKVAHQRLSVAYVA